MPKSTDILVRPLTRLFRLHLTSDVHGVSQKYKLHGKHRRFRVYSLFP